VGALFVSAAPVVPSRLAGGPGATARGEEGVDHFEHSTLVGGWEGFDLLEALEKARRLRRSLFHGRLEAHQLVEGAAERLRKVHEQSAGGLRTLVFVVGDDPLGDVHQRAELRLGQASLLPHLGEPGADARDGLVPPPSVPPHARSVP